MDRDTSIHLFPFPARHLGSTATTDAADTYSGLTQIEVADRAGNLTSAGLNVVKDSLAQPPPR